MRANPEIRTQRQRQQAMTLIETVVGLAILGTIVSTMVVARGRFHQQLALATRKTTACAVADGLLSGWWQDPQKFPRSASGMLIQDKLWWRTHIVNSADDLGIQIVGLDIFDAAVAASGDSAGQLSAKPLAHVEVVLNRAKETSSVHSSSTSGPATDNP